MHDRRTVLVVDDDDLVRDVLCHSLESIGHKVTCCEDGETALRIARKRTFDAVVTDYRMPGIDGTIVAGAIRALHPGAIIIGISGDDDGRKLIAAGAHVFLKKPIDFDHLGAILRGERTV